MFAMRGRTSEMMAAERKSGGSGRRGRSKFIGRKKKQHRAGPASAFGSPPLPTAAKKKQKPRSAGKSSSPKESKNGGQKKHMLTPNTSKKLAFEAGKAKAEGRPQQEVADEFGVSQSCVSRILTTDPTLAAVRR